MMHIKFSISTSDSRPLFKQIVDAIRMQIADGTLEAGAKLPSVRSLAMEKTISVNTVAKAYNILTAQGLLVSKPGLGIFVDERRQLLSVQEQEKQLDSAIESFVNDVSHLQIDNQTILQKLKKRLSKLKKLGLTQPF